jgi:intracellular sulfur oxidation DsrE/DsrF family protein
MTDRSSLPRRRLLSVVAAAATAGTALSAQAANDGPPHKIVYQLNRPEPEYQEAILNSVGAMLKKYVDDVAIAVVVWGPGIHLLAKKPQRPVAPVLQQRVKSMSESYGVEFVACGNTMHSLNWSKADMLDVARIEEVGAAALMEYQERATPTWLGSQTPAKARTCASTLRPRALRL